MRYSYEVPRYPLHVIAGVAAAVCLGLAALFVGINPHESFTAVDGSAGTATCANVWSHMFGSSSDTATTDAGGEPLPPITLTASANGTDEPTLAAYSAADTACDGAISTYQGLTGVFFFAGLGAAGFAIYHKRRANQTDPETAREGARV